MSVYYPSCVCNIRLRFDEAFSVDETKDTRSTESLLNSVAQPGGKAGVRPHINDTPLVVNAISRSLKSKLNAIMNRVPLSCSVELPSYRAAGSFKMEIEYADLPIDPRLVRSATVEVYMGAVDPKDFSSGMTSVELDGSRRSIIRTSTDDGNRREDLLLGVFQVDTWHVNHSSSGSRASLEGRDLRSLFLDTEIDVRGFKDIKLDNDILSIVQQIVKLHPFGHGNPKQQGGGITVTIQEGDFPDGVPKLASTPFTKVRQKVSDGSTVSKPQGGEKLNFWDLITKYCYLVGCIPFFVADRIVIRRSLDLYQQLTADAPPGAFEEGKQAKPPFAGGRQRELEDGTRFGVRRIVYGRDIAECNFERKLTGFKTPVVEVVSVDPSNKKRGAKDIRVRWPEKKNEAGASGVSGADSSKKGEKVVGKVSDAKKTSISVSGEVEEEIIRIPAHGIRDKEQLLGIAKAVREEIARGEMGGSVQTKSLASFGTNPNNPVSGNSDPDLLRLRPGDAVEILIDTRAIQSRAPNVSSYTDSRRRSFAEEVKALEERLGSSGMAADVARVIVAQSRGGILQLQTFFRVGNAKFDFDKSSGISIAFDYQNFVEVRNAVSPSNPKGARDPKTQYSGESVTVTQKEEQAAATALEEQR